MSVIVVGGGIIGASIAWHLSTMGADVTVVDAGLPAASQTSFGWINASFYADAAHHRLRVASMAAYEDLSAQLDLSVNKCGALWWEEQGAALHKMKFDLQAIGYKVKYLNSEALYAAEPTLVVPATEALQFPFEAAAEPANVATQLLNASGAKIVRGAKVQSITVDGVVTGVQTDIGHIPADKVVVAAGTGTEKIMGTAGVSVPMLRRPGVLVTTQPIAAKIDHILVTPNGEVRQLPNGRLMASAVANHQGDDASEISETPTQIAERVLAWLSPMIGTDLVCHSVDLAFRPMPVDGLPVIGAVGAPGLHVAVMHSGVTLAAITGAATAAEVLGQGQDHYADLLAPYRPARFQ